MTTKVDLQQKLKEIGYDISPYASKDTLSIIIRLHKQAVENGANVAAMDDIQLRKDLKDYGVEIGPVTSHTRAIYQRKLLELIMKETTEGNDDEMETEDVSSTAGQSPTTGRKQANQSASPPTTPVKIAGITTRSGKQIFHDCN